MSMFKKFVGIDRQEQIAERLIADARARADRGEREFTLGYTQDDMGMRSSASSWAPVISRELAKAGFEVTGGERGGFGDPVTLHIVVPAR